MNHQLHNNTKLTPNDIKVLNPLGAFRNNWRQRTVGLYDHPTHPDMVISIGIGDTMTVICEEDRSLYRRQLVNGDWSDYN